MPRYAATLEDVRKAHERIVSSVHRTPVLTCTMFDKLAGRKLFFKCENFQKVGAFKFRGACHAVMKLTPGEAAKGVVTHSSGNHAQALALAASMHDIEAHVVMPDNAPEVKRRAVEGYGGKVYPCAPTLAAREDTAADVVARTGATFIPPYNHPDIIAGQGTVALELMDQVDDLDAVIAPVGGGGLSSGICVAAQGIDPSIQIFAAEPEGADDAARSFAAGRLLPQTSPHTVADGLLTSLGDLTWPIISDYLTEILTVSDEQIIAAMRLVWSRMKIVIEPSAAVAVAAVLSDEFKAKSALARIGVVLSGGNVDLDRLPW